MDLQISGVLGMNNKSPLNRFLFLNVTKYMKVAHAIELLCVMEFIQRVELA
jgi:hypothetical protein